MRIGSGHFVTATFFAALTLAAFTARADAAPIFADSALTSVTTAFGGGVLTGAPDGGGHFLSDTVDPPTLLGSITAGFSAGLVDGPGIDLVIHDCCESPDIAPRGLAAAVLPEIDEFADVFVSTDGITFTFLGAYGGPGRIGSFDFSGVYAGAVHFVRIVATGKVDSPDIDAFEGRYTATAPEPVALALMGIGFAAIALRAARRPRG